MSRPIQEDVKWQLPMSDVFKSANPNKFHPNILKELVKELPGPLFVDPSPAVLGRF